MNLSERQSNNVSVLTPKIVEVIKKRQFRDASTALLVCVSCNKKNITAPIVKYFNFEGEKLLCYFCQNQTQATEPVALNTLPVDRPIERQIQNIVAEKKFDANKNFREWENRDNSITDKQLGLLRQLINEKVEDEREKQIQLDSIGELTKAEGSAAIARLLNNAF